MPLKFFAMWSLVARRSFARAKTAVRLLTRLHSFEVAGGGAFEALLTAEKDSILPTLTSQKF
jgi:hypothetical protein